MCIFYKYALHHAIQSFHSSKWPTTSLLFITFIYNTCGQSNYFGLPSISTMAIVNNRTLLQLYNSILLMNEVIKLMKSYRSHIYRIYILGMLYQTLIKLLIPLFLHTHQNESALYLNS